MEKSNTKFVLSILLGIVVLVILFFVIKNNQNKKADTMQGINTVAIYDSTLNTKYITSQNPWPPEVFFSDGNLECNVGGSAVLGGGITVKKVIDGKNYCVITASEGAAGSTYTTYTYSTIIDGKLATTNFVLKFVQCENYDDPQKTECKNEQASFDIDKLANAIIMNATPDEKSIALCFANYGKVNAMGYSNKYSLNMLLTGSKAVGNLKLIPAEKDSKVGTFIGTVSPVDKVMMARTMDLIWTAIGEGVTNKEELRIIFGEGTASIGMGEMVKSSNGIYVYKDKTKLNYDLKLTDIACEQLDNK